MRLFMVLCVTMFATSSTWAMKNGSTALRPGSRAVIGISNCSAVVIHPRVVLTAAHCADGLSKGWSNKVHFTDRRSTQQLDIQEIYIHKGYAADPLTGSSLKANDDIAVVTLRTAITDPDVLADIPRLATKDDLANYESRSFVATGLGYMKTTGRPELGDSSNYQRASTPHRILEIQASVLFIETTVPGAGVCHADSGGALMQEIGGKAVLMGIITIIGSEMKWCGLKGEISYAESVAHQLKFIRASAAADGIIIE